MPKVAITRARMAVAAALASAAAAAGVVALAARAQAGGALALSPDLVVLVPAREGLRVYDERGHRVLRHSTEIANHGVGPLEIFPSAASENCDDDRDRGNDRDALQRTFADTDGDGGYRPGIDGIESERVIGCMRYHAAHDHWHVLEFARYELRREPHGRLVAKRRKVGFCVGDNRIAFGAVGVPATPVYPYGPPGSVGCDELATQGLSIGWADLYAYDVPGQDLAVTGLAPGRYCLVTRADPRDLIAEANEANNVRRTLVGLDPKHATVTRLAGKCRS